MSINHYSSDTQETTSLWWKQQQQQQKTHQQEEELETLEDEVVLEKKTKTNEAVLEEEKEPMFEKPLTPSDVGKLNRLVIPKQHAERFFPLDSEEIKGLLLSFEDESGKCWRFRYSYWNSSQSYVLTKGWSRYVKDKRLDAGDVVLFQRHRLVPQRFFIYWRRRCNGSITSQGGVSSNRSVVTNGNGGSVGWSNKSVYHAHPYPTHHHLPLMSYHAGGGSESQNQITTPCGNSSSSSTSRVLRLFGVNMECQPENNIINNNDSQTLTPIPQFYHHLHRQPSSNPQHHMLHQQPY